MKVSGNTILIAEGGSGLGIAVAKSLLRAGNQVILCGRNPEKLDEALASLPNLHTYVCNVASDEDRRRLGNLVCHHFPRFNVLINDAALVEVSDLTRADAAEGVSTELEVDLQSPIQLTMLFLTHLMAQPEAAVVNITAPAALVAGNRYPTYRAAHAGLRSFAKSLRRFLDGTSVAVVEVLSSTAESSMNARRLASIGPHEVADLLLREMHRAVPGDRRRRTWIGATLGRLLPRAGLTSP